MSKRIPPSRLKDLTGQRFGRLTVISRNGNSGKSAAWLCKCSCGAMPTISSKHLCNGGTVSCGCYRLESSSRRMKIHGMTNTKEWRIWKGIKDRCCVPKSQSYHLYGARGITLCQRWYTFSNFFADMGPCPQDKTSIDRIDNNGPYSPENCRWASMKEQANNRSNNIVLTLNGESMTMKEWSCRTGVSYHALVHRFHRGWSVERMLTQPQAKRASSR